MSSSSRPPRAASINDRRASIALRQQSRPASTTEEQTKRTIKTTDLRHDPVQTSSRTTVGNGDRHASSANVKDAWHPTATLLPMNSTNAPLATRVSVPPQAKHAPTALHGPVLGGLNLRQQEKAMLDDLLFVLMGFEGQYITYSVYDPFEEKSRLSGPTYTIAPGLDLSLRDLTQQILQTASAISAIEAFVEVMSKGDCGSISHALCAAIRRILKDSLILVAQLEHQHLTNDGFSLHQMSLHLNKSSHVLRRLFSLTQQILTANGLLGSLQNDDDDDDDNNTSDEDDFENVLANINGTSTKSKRSCLGGALLVLLTKSLHTLSGDPKAQDLLSSLLSEASKPYMRMLNEWLHHGNVKDPHNEFMIKEAKSIRREVLELDYTDEYWEKRYTLRQDLVPPQLTAVCDRILLAGKYLNVVRECSSGETFLANFGQTLGSLEGMPVDIFDTNLHPSVNGAYHHANAALIKLLLTTHHLPQRLKSLKHYFLLDRSDWFTYFLELSHSELRKHAKQGNAGKLQSLLDLVLHTPGSVAAEDPFKEDVRIIITNTALTGWLMRVVNIEGMDADATALTNSHTATESMNGKDDEDIRVHQVLMLDSPVPFPLSLIISRVMLTRYQLLFRYLLSLKYLEYQLTVSWSEAGGIGSVSRHSSTPYAEANAWRRRTGGARIDMWKRRASCLRSRMLTFVQQLLYFCTAEVIDPAWKVFMTRVSASQQSDAQESNGSGSPKRTVDELMQDHVDFLATCLKDCMLTNSKLLRINSKVTSTCAHFATYTASFTRSLDRVAPPGSAEVNNEELNKLFNILNQYEQHFSRHLKILLDALNYLAATETVGFLGLCARLSMAAEGGANGGLIPAAAVD